MDENRQPAMAPTAGAGKNLTKVGAWDRAYDRLVNTGSKDSWSGKFRSRRWEQLSATFPSIGTSTVLDLGGTVSSWETSDLRPALVTIVNVELEQPMCTQFYSLLWVLS